MMPNGRMETIVLTGPKHSGKTSAGRALAALFSCVFFDLDDLVKQRTGKSPRQLYIEAPAIFQKSETEALADILGGAETGSTNRRVIATGGGIIDNPDAVAILANSGALVVYLNVSAGCAWDRIADGELPPFLKTENPKETHRALHERRAAAYSKFAKIVIEAEGKTPEEIVAQIYQKLQDL
ncbi:MAG: shikimate kinase [Treponema sp.]|jgi:shikimate kinase|nr:shikimate kinase [Treponema sp.]